MPKGNEADNERAARMGNENGIGIEIEIEMEKEICVGGGGKLLEAITFLSLPLPAQRILIRIKLSTFYASRFIGKISIAITKSLPC